MLVSPLLGPEISIPVISQITQLSYLMRNMARISGENVGFPKSIPDERKADYLFRDYFFVPVMAAGNETGIRLAESTYVMPTQIKLLGLNNLRDLYTKGSIHRPNLAPYFDIKNYSREVPPFLREYILGSTINTRSYSITPELLHTRTIPKINKTAHPTEQYEARLLAHHLQRIFHPTDYINRFLLKEGRITKEEADTLNHFKGIIDDAYKVFSDARSSGKFKELQTFLAPHIQTAQLQNNAWLKQWFTPQTQSLERKVLGPKMRDFLKYLGDKGFKKGFSWLKQQSSFHPDQFINGIHANLLEPLMHQKLPHNTKMMALLKDLVTDKIRAQQCIAAFQAAEVWFKVPVSIIFQTILYGIVGGYFDVKYVQPLQDLVVKLRGDSKEIQAPTYLGTIVGAVAGYSVFKSPFIKRMGHLPSFLAAFAAFEAGQIGTTYALFKRVLAKPPKNKGKYRVAYTDNPFHQSQLKANTVQHS